MLTKERTTEIVIATLAEKVERLELEVWCREEKIKELKAELEAAKVGGKNG